VILGSAGKRKGKGADWRWCKRQINKCTWSIRSNAIFFFDACVAFPQVLKWYSCALFDFGLICGTHVKRTLQEKLVLQTAFNIRDHEARTILTYSYRFFTTDLFASESLLLLERAIDDSDITLLFIRFQFQHSVLTEGRCVYFGKRNQSFNKIDISYHSKE
jgi:hypothetical protein